MKLPSYLSLLLLFSFPLLVSGGAQAARESRVLVHCEMAGDMHEWALVQEDIDSIVLAWFVDYPGGSRRMDAIRFPILSIDGMRISFQDLASSKRSKFVFDPSDSPRPLMYELFQLVNKQYGPRDKCFVL